MKGKILLVGLGQLGSRYLQGFLAGDSKLVVDIIEPSDESFDIGMKAVRSTLSEEIENVSRVNWDSLTTRYEICIVATSAEPRAQLIESLAHSTNIEYWVLEKVLAQSEQQCSNIQTVVGSSRGAWVNTPRRRTSIYRKLKSLLDESRPLKFEVKFPELGLGCNAIHFIDVVSWLAAEEVSEVSIEAPGGWRRSKRQGYQDFDGKMIVRYRGGSVLDIDSHPDVANGIEVTQGSRAYRLEESKGIKDGTHFFPCRLEYQSELSFRLVEDILNGRIADGLPTVRQSISQHLELFKAIRCCGALKLNSQDELPIT